MTTDHQMFTVTRQIAARPETVFRCWFEPPLKKRWFTEMNPPEFKTLEYSIEPRVGGIEKVVFRHGDMGDITYEGRFLEIKATERIVYAYVMEASDKSISASLSTFTLAKNSTGTALNYTEQVVFLDNGDSLKTRIPGTETMLDRTVQVCEELEAAQ